MNIDGSNLTRLTQSDDNDSGPVWSPDGTKIAFSSLRDGNFEVYVMNADGSNPINLTNDEEARDTAPSWSADGSRIVFISYRNGSRGIYVINADGSNVVNLVDDMGKFATAAWSPAR